MSPTTVVKICKMHNIEWQHGLDLSEDSVREALQGRTTSEAASLLDCCVQTLHNRFPHLLLKRKSPDFLQGQIEAVYKKATQEGISEAARVFDTNRVTVLKALKKAGLWDEYRAATVGKQNSRKGRIR
jgi:hypothetical protein